MILSSIHIYMLTMYKSKVLPPPNTQLKDDRLFSIFVIFLELILKGCHSPQCQELQNMKIFKSFKSFKVFDLVAYWVNT